MEQLMALGFSRALSELALRLNHGDVNQAIEFCVENGEESVKLFEGQGGSGGPSNGQFGQHQTSHNPCGGFQGMEPPEAALGLSREEFNSIVGQSMNQYGVAQNTNQYGASRNNYQSPAQSGFPAAGFYGHVHSDGDDWQEQLAILESKELAEKQQRSRLNSHPAANDEWEEIPPELLADHAGDGTGSQMYQLNAPKSPSSSSSDPPPSNRPSLHIQTEADGAIPTVISSPVKVNLNPYSPKVPPKAPVGSPSRASTSSSDKKSLLSMQNLKVKPLSATSSSVSAAGLSSSAAPAPNFLPQMQKQHSQMATISQMTSFITSATASQQPTATGSVSFLKQFQKSYGVAPSHSNQQSQRIVESARKESDSSAVAVQSYGAARQEQYRSRVQFPNSAYGQQQEQPFTYRRPDASARQQYLYESQGQPAEYEEEESSNRYGSQDNYNNNAVASRGQSQYRSDQYNENTSASPYDRSPPRDDPYANRGQQQQPQQQYQKYQQNQQYQQYQQHSYQQHQQQQHQQQNRSPVDNSRFSSPHTGSEHLSPITPLLRVDQIYANPSVTKYPSPERYYSEPDSGNNHDNNQSSFGLGQEEQYVQEANYDNVYNQQDNNYDDNVHTNDQGHYPNSYEYQQQQQYYHQQQQDPRSMPQAEEQDLQYGSVYDDQYVGGPQQPVSNNYTGHYNQQYQNYYQDGAANGGGYGDEEYYEEDRVDSDEEREEYERRRAQQNTFASAKSEDYGDLVDVVDESLFTD
jgi:hypothetical protein